MYYESTVQLTVPTCIQDTAVCIQCPVSKGLSAWGDPSHAKLDWLINSNDWLFSQYHTLDWEFQISLYLDLIFHSRYCLVRIVMKLSVGMGCPLAVSYEILWNMTLQTQWVVICKFLGISALSDFFVLSTHTPSNLCNIIIIAGLVESDV